MALVALHTTRQIRRRALEAKPEQMARRAQVAKGQPLLEASQACGRQLQVKREKLAIQAKVVAEAAVEIQTLLALADSEDAEEVEGAVAVGEVDRLRCSE